MAKIGFIGLGRMGKAMVLRLLEQGVSVVAYNRTVTKVDELVQEISDIKYPASSSGRQISKTHIKDKKFGELIPVYSLGELVNNLKPPRIIWLMVPHGPPVDEMINKLLEAGIERGDIVIDGGNSFYKDSVRRYQQLKQKGINFLDVGTSGGLEGARYGACLMVGGDLSVYNEVRPCFEVMVGSKGNVAYFGPSGAGHFVKMVHNGVEYGMLQAIGEGFEILEKGPYKLDLRKVAFNWVHGSVVRGWLMELLEKALAKDPRLATIEGIVGGGETGSWTIEVGKELGVKTPVMEKSLEARKKSLAKPTFSGKVVAALRREFGGHEIKLKAQNSKIKT